VSEPADLLSVTSLVVAALDAVGVPYSIGGSLASSFSGEPRASIDSDILVEMTAAQAGPFLTALGEAFYTDTESIARGIASGTATNLIHQASGIKVDLFFARSILDERELTRRRRIQVSPGREWFIHSPEDILLQKLVWYRAGGEVSDRQWRDVVAIVRRQGGALDRAYLEETARLIGVADLAVRALAD
jgi:hypothetical protein